MQSSIDTSLIIGQLQGVASAIQSTLTRVLDGQELARAELKAHSEDDRRIATELREALGIHRDRLIKLEGIADSVESHGDALLTMERRFDQQADLASTLDEQGLAIEELKNRLATRDDKDKALQITHQANVKWSRGIVALAGVIAIFFGAAAGSAVEKFFKWVLTVMPK